MCAIYYNMIIIKKKQNNAKQEKRSGKYKGDEDVTLVSFCYVLVFRRQETPLCHENLIGRYK